ncbi:MAG TPA: DUF5667 domain-containing protein [Nocardioides sp.]|uniref:DUF5667 domain-containing protein n=1 Tax=Nocardioides sp. TaxID=35761 RepID=UPI002ED7904B
MTPAFTGRRRAEQFQQLLERRAVPSDAPDELAHLLSLTSALREAPAVAPRPEFAADLRERLMTAAPTAMAAGAVADRLTVGRTTPTARTRRERRLGAAIGVFALIGATGATAVASEGALPGDTLYPIKRLVEDVRAGVSMDDGARAGRLLAQADTRLLEVNELTARGADEEAEAIADALQDFSVEASEASDLLLDDYRADGDPAAIERLREFAADGVVRLGDLQGVLPDRIHEALASAVQTLINIDSAAAQVCPGCTEAGISELPGNLLNLVAGSLTGVGLTDGGEAAVPVSTPSPALSGPVPATGKPSPTPGSTTGGTVPLPAGGAVTGAPKPTKPAPSPTSAGGVVGGVGGAVGDVGESVGGTVGGVVGGVGETVEGVGGTVDGVTGGLLGGLTGQ